MNSQLQKNLGLGGALILGLGSILGTGIFVSLPLAVGITGPSILFAIPLAGVLALFNGLNSANLAANHPSSGGAYEYGYHYLHPLAGFSAGWLFLVAKGASAGAGTLGLVAYFRFGFGVAVDPRFIAGGVLLVLTILTLFGLRKTNRVNLVLVVLSLFSLLGFGILGIFSPVSGPFPATPIPWFIGGYGRSGFLYATALVFVAFTGYGRVATLGEEVHDPRKTIPRAVGLTLAVTILVYGVVAAGLVRLVGSNPAPETLLGVTPQFWTPVLLLGGATAMAGVVLNLILGLSRVVLAMGRRGDLPVGFSRLNSQRTVPGPAVLFSAGIIGVFIALGNLGLAWSFSAFTVLLYYGITAAAALAIPRSQSLFPPWVGVMGLLGCLGLAFFVDLPAILGGIGSLAAGLLWFAFRARIRGTR